MAAVELIELNTSGRERRQSELALAAWERIFAALGRSPTLAEVFEAIDSEEWSYGFVVAVDPDIEISSLLTYGSKFARLLGMPERGMPFVKMTRQLPPRYSQVFLRGCTDACAHDRPVQVEGETAREDGYTELFRAVFIPIRAEEKGAMRYAFGRFNLRVAEPQS